MDIAQTLLSPLSTYTSAILLAFSAQISSADIHALKQKSFAELLQTRIATSVSKKQRSVTDSSAAIFVITQEDIRQSGITHVAEALRMAPGINVVRTSASQWRVSARGTYNGLFVNKLLVLIDGRSVYNTQIAGVFWDVVDMLIDDIERIEVIRGPGGTLWGANAVNGVINIITKNAQDTQGVLAKITGGTEQQRSISLRYGEDLGDERYARVYMLDRKLGPFQDPLDDSLETQQFGFRIDDNAETRKQRTWLVHGDWYQVERNDLDWQTLAPDQANMHGGNILGQYTWFDGKDKSWQLQAYYDYNERNNSTLGFQNHTLNVELQRNIRLNDHELVWGLGYRWLRSEIPSSSFLTRAQLTRQENLFNLFIQDDISLSDKVRLTLGAKLEHNEYTGLEAQPNIRLLWRIRPNLNAWAAISRAVRTPAQTSDHLIADVSLPEPFNPLYPYPLQFSLRGREDIESETLLAYELGIRHALDSHLSWDLSLFAHRYKRLIVRTDLLGMNASQTGYAIYGLFGNQMDGESHGAELALNWQYQKHQVQIAYTWLRMYMHSSQDPLNLTNFERIEQENPQHLFSLRHHWQFHPDWQINTWLRYQSFTISETQAPINSFWSTDLSLAWQISKQAELSLIVQNLLDPGHEELSSNIFNPLVVEIPRRAYVQLRLSF